MAGGENLGQPPVWPDRWPIDRPDLDQGSLEPLYILPAEQLSNPKGSEQSRLMDPVQNLRRPDFRNGIESTPALIGQPQAPTKRNSENPAKRFVRWILEDHVQHVQARLRADAKNVTLGQTVKTLATTAAEMIPDIFPIPIPWGPGDIITAIEGLAGHTMDGLKLSIAERALYFIASAIPVVPARPLVAVYRWAEKRGIEMYRGFMGNQK